MYNLKEQLSQIKYNLKIDLIGTFVKLKFEKNQKTVFIYLP